MYFDYSNSKDCFTGISISGGVGYFLRNSYYNGKCCFINNINSERKSMSRFLSEFNVVVRYNEAVSIVRKVNKKTISNLSTITSSISPFALSTTIRGHENKTVNDYKLFSSKGISYIDKSEIPKGFEWIGIYKVMLSQTGAEHAMEPSMDGTFRVLTSTMTVLDKNDVCTHSYILIGKYNNKSEPQSLLKYIKTKFVRFLILQSVSSIHISKSTLQFVPLQNFTSNSDIDWSRSIGEIDAQLYAKYGLEKDEIEFIERMIKPME